jgi:hypothetical protein
MKFVASEKEDTHSMILKLEMDLGCMVAKVHVIHVIFNVSSACSQSTRYGIRHSDIQPTLDSCLTQCSIQQQGTTTESYAQQEE